MEHIKTGRQEINEIWKNWRVHGGEWRTKILDDSNVQNNKTMASPDEDRCFGMVQPEARAIHYADLVDLKVAKD